VYSTLLFFPATQTCYLEDGYEEFFDEEFLAYTTPVAFLWIMEPSVVLQVSDEEF
jgi:hypothetical protein